MKTFLASVPMEKWSDGAFVFLSLLALVAFLGLLFVLLWSIARERRKFLEEKRSYIDGILSSSEIKSSINQLISKTSFDIPFNIVLLDIDKYSQMVSAFGDKIAKDVIVLLANRFEKTVPFQVQIGRLADDKFLFMFKPEYEFEEVYHVVQQLKAIFDEPVRVSYDVEVSLTTSIALCTYPRHGRNVSQILESLNIAIYTAKRNGGDKVVVYSEDMGQEEEENIQYYEQVKLAIENKEFKLLYQPIVDVQTEKVVAAEALLRWEHPKLGMINPKEFLNILESSGDIYWVGIWGLESMIEEYSAIKSMYPYKEISLSINLSMKQLLNERLVIDFMKILKKYKVQAKSFILELEEFIMFERHDKIRNTILKLREAGFKIAVDGFSFDHNTLLKIEQLPIDYIKLDSNFIQNDSKEIMKHLTNLLITFAKEHNITIIAERIEELETVEHFKEYNINLIQGYLISKPISADAFVTFIGDDTNVIKKLSGEEEEIEVIEEVQAEVETVIEDVETVVEETVEQPEVVEEPQVEEVQEENNQNNE